MTYSPTWQEIDAASERLGKMTRIDLAAYVLGLETMLRRIADANVIFPSMCANNMEAWNITEELKAYRSKPQPEREP